MPVSSQQSQLSTRAWVFYGALLTLLILVVGTLYLPALDLELIGDDYQWIQLAHWAQHDPYLLVADLDSFYRPASTWSLIFDRLVWGFNAAGFHLTNLILHLIASFLLALVAVRLGLGRWIALGVAVLWGTSVFATEPAISVAIRFQNLLLISWLALLLVWPLRHQSWTRSRLLAVSAVLFMAVFSKETWVTTPALVLVLEWAERGFDWRRLFRSVTPVAAAAMIYVGCYFVAFPSDKGYYEWTTGTLIKVPHMLAAFLGFEILRPLEFTITWTAILALLLVVAMTALVASKRSSAGLVGVTLMVLATLPTLLVPLLPIRYTAIPYAGFLLLFGAGVEHGLARLDGPVRKAVAASVGMLAAVVLIAGCVAVRAELADWTRVSDHHARLLEEARRVVDQLPNDHPVVVVRDENVQPLGEVARDPRGLAKLWFPRHPHPYGLIDVAALFEWVSERDDLKVYKIEASPTPAALLLHQDGGFRWVEPVADGRQTVQELASRGYRLRTLEAVTFER